VKRLLLMTCLLLTAQENTPPDVVQFLRDVGSDLTNAHADPANQPYASPALFLDHFDASMPGFTKLREYVEELTARADVGSVIEVASESGDERKREMQLDWVLEIQDKTLTQDRPPRRELIKCTIEKKGKKWKFVAFEPIEFFKY
jgi:hypothetical protein